MTADLWPCACGAAGVRNVGSEGKCARHLGELYATFDPAVFKLNGVGLPGASADDRHLTCCACGATWIGPPGEPCYYCARSRRIQLEHQAELVLTPPDIDPDDINYETRMSAWGQRLIVAARAGIIDQHTADRAWRKWVNRAAA